MNEIHTHKFSSDWTHDESYHWHQSTCDCNEISDKTEHTFSQWQISKQPSESENGSQNRSCTSCSYTQTEAIPKLEHTHKFSPDWTHDDSYHWHQSTCDCNEISDKAEHTFTENICEICKYIKDIPVKFYINDNQNKISNCPQELLTYRHGNDWITNTLNNCTYESTKNCEIINLDEEITYNNTNDYWKYFYHSETYWSFKANTNYLITIEVKSDKNKTLLFQAHARGAETSNFIYKTIGTEWQTIKIETGCWNTDWEGILQIAGDLRGKTYFKNMKMEQIESSRIPTTQSNQINCDINSTIEQVSNGIKYTSNIETSDYNQGIDIAGNFVERNHNYLYKISFNVIADKENVDFFYAVAHTSEKHNVWGYGTASTTRKQFSLYMPTYEDVTWDLIEASLYFSLKTKNSITITDITLEPLTTIPTEQAIFYTCDYVNYDKKFYLGSEHFIIAEIQPKSSTPLEIVMENSVNDKMLWNASCKFSKYNNKSCCDIQIDDTWKPIILNNTDTIKYCKVYLDETWIINIEDYEPTN